MIAVRIVTGVASRISESLLVIHPGKKTLLQLRPLVLHGRGLHSGRRVEGEGLVDDGAKRTSSPWAVGSNSPAPLKGSITSGLLKGSSGGSKSKYRAKADQRGEMWDPASKAIVPLPPLLDRRRPPGLSVDHMAEGNVFVRALNEAGYSYFESLPYDARVLLSKQINHSRNVLVVPKYVEVHKGPAFCKSLAGRPAKVPPETMDLISGVDPYVQAHLADTDREWEKLRALHTDVRQVRFLETYLKAVNMITMSDGEDKLAETIRRRIS